MSARSPGYRALLFDLFRTVLLFTPQAPTGQVHEPTWRGAMAGLRAQFEAILPPPQFEPFLDALVAASDDIARARAPEYRELPIEERYQRALRRIGCADAQAADMAARLSEIQLAAQVANSVLPADHAAALDDLGARYRLGLVSNFDHGPAARAVLARHGLDRRFASIAISIEVGRRKPHPQIFRRALRELGVEASQALFIGDSPREDVGGASAVGMDTAWVNAAGKAWPEGLAAPTYVLSSLGDLTSVLA
jgi:HAD superfamily hydrolase (TIGR01549 family)